MNSEDAMYQLVELLDKEVKLESLEILAVTVNGDRRLAVRLFNNMGLSSYGYSTLNVRLLIVMHYNFFLGLSSIKKVMEV